MNKTETRLALIKARHAEAGGGDGDKEWLIARLEAAQKRLSELEDKREQG